jgi:hypothetical protein
MEEASVLFEKELRVVVENIVVGGDPFFADLQWRIASLPIKFGRLGVFSSRRYLICIYGFQGPMLGFARWYIET